MRSSALCTVMCGAIKIYAVHNQRLTRIICINKSHAEICRFRVLNNNKISVSSKTWEQYSKPLGENNEEKVTWYAIMFASHSIIYDQ